VWRINQNKETTHTQKQGNKIMDCTAEEVARFATAASAGIARGVMIYDNLEIPDDIAESIDAANWVAGSGLSDSSGRREVFRARRAAARNQTQGTYTVDKLATWDALCAVNKIAHEQTQEIDRLRAENASLLAELKDPHFRTTTLDVLFTELENSKDSTQ
jgi:hypothetical protein